MNYLDYLGNRIFNFLKGENEMKTIIVQINSKELQMIHEKNIKVLFQRYEPSDYPCRVLLCFKDNRGDESFVIGTFILLKVIHIYKNEFYSNPFYNKHVLKLESHDEIQYVTSLFKNRNLIYGWMMSKLEMNMNTMNLVKYFS